MQNTNDLSSLGNYEFQLLAELLQAYATNRDILGDNVRWEFNPTSGNVFLVDDDFNVAMVNDETGEIELFLTCLNCGAEGFASDDFRIAEDGQYCTECKN